MGTKILWAIGLIGAVVFTYIIMFALQPATNTIVASANATGNWTGFESTQGIINSYPLWQWIIPGFVGLALLVMIWRSTD